MATFADRIEELRKERKETQKAVADAVDMSERNYQTLEYGKIKPSHDNIIKLADHFEVTTDYLLGRTNHWMDAERNIHAKVPPDFLNMDAEELKKQVGKDKE